MRCYLLMHTEGKKRVTSPLGEVCMCMGQGSLCFVQ